MAKSSKKITPSKRTALYRRRAERSGISRVEVAVPESDVTHIRTFARVLREGGTVADRLRLQGSQIEKPAIARTGKELVALLRRGAHEGFPIELPSRTYDEPRDTGILIMSDFLLDTNILSEIYRPDANEKVLRWIERQDPENLFLTVFAIAETRIGVEKLPSGKKRAEHQAWLEDYVLNNFEGRIIPFDLKAADIWANLTANDRKKRKTSAHG